MKKMFKSWKTFVGGLLFAAPVAIPALAPYKDLIQGAAGLLIGTAAADADNKPEEKKN